MVVGGLVPSGDGLTRQCGIKGFYLEKSWYSVILNNIGIHIISTYLLVSKHQTISNLTFIEKMYLQLYLHTVMKCIAILT